MKILITNLFIFVFFTVTLAQVQPPQSLVKKNRKLPTENLKIGMNNKFDFDKNFFSYLGIKIASSKEKVRLIQRGKYYLIEDDIIVGYASVIDSLYNNFIKIPKNNLAFAIVADPSLIRGRWENGIVPFKFNGAFSDNEKNIIIKSLNDIIQQTNVIFVPNSDDDEHHISFVLGAFNGIIGGSSFVGQSFSDEQEVTIVDVLPGSVKHEVCHALGLYHEMSREDRDEHIEILWDNIIDEVEYDFDQHIYWATDVGVYDFNSITHYPVENSGSITKGLPTFRVRDNQNIPNPSAIGMGTNLSIGDIAAINSMYTFSNSNILLDTIDIIPDSMLPSEHLRIGQVAQVVVRASRKKNRGDIFVKKGEIIRFTTRNNDTWTDNGEKFNALGKGTLITRACLENPTENLMSMLCYITNDRTPTAAEITDSEYFNLGENFTISIDHNNMIPMQTTDIRIQKDGFLYFRANECDDFEDNSGSIELEIKRIQ